MAKIKCPKCGYEFEPDAVHKAQQAEIDKQVKKAEEQFKKQLALELKVQQSKTADEYAKKVHELETKIAKLDAEKKAELLTQLNKEKQSFIKEKEQLNNKILELTQKNHSQKETSDTHIKILKEELESIKKFQKSQSTKMRGENLEQHCLISFEKELRLAFPRAKFGKDNQVVEGTKSDFIFKDYLENGLEYISICFEMKTEDDETKTKHKNEDFYAKLDSDRKKKGCIYAVLVSTLEADNELFNEGVYQVHDYENMFVIRPYFFTGIIRLLTSIHRNNRALIVELDEKKKLNIDYTNFENAFMDFKKDVNYNAQLYSKKNTDLLAQIDKSISSLQKMKDDIISMNRQLGLIDSKVQNMTIRKLTANAPSVRKEIEKGSKKNEK